MVTAARSRSVHGPWENCPHNPIVHTKSADEPWWSRGHATVVQGPGGDWWMIYHGYENGFRTLGRQTLLEPVEWTPDGWFSARGGTLSQPIAKPAKGLPGPSGFALSDDFSTNRFGVQWTFFNPGPDEAKRARYTAQGTYLISYLSSNNVVEYDTNFNEIWRYGIRSPWAAMRLKNGNTLITDEGDALTREVNHKGETVWEFKSSELPEAYRLVQAPQSCTRLANGNTIFTSRGGAGKGPQLVEVSPEKNVVWVLQDWQDLGDATAVQILDDPGVPEIPGESQH
jgi:hypothetical protein